MGLTMVNADASLATAAAVGRGLYHIDARHRNRALCNITRSLPDLTQAQVNRLAQATFEHLAQLAMEVCHTPRIIGPDSWADRISLTDMGTVIQLLNSGQPALLVTGHVGNWELLGYLLATLGYKVHALARPLDNPYLNRWLLGIREQRGLSIITKWDATEQMISVIDRRELLAFIADQNAGDRGMFVPFFGKLASTYKSIGLLALSQNLPIICGYAKRTGKPQGCHYQLGTTDIIHPQDWADQPDPLYYITARYMRAIESMVRLCPDQYFWMHRRWKSRPKWEREGKPMPASMRRNLESLPWMTAPQVEQLALPMTQDDLKI